MAATHKGGISFGLVYIPVALHTATTDNDIRFNQLCKDGSRVAYKKVCSSCGKEVGPGDIVKGFQYEKDKYVVVTDEDFEKIKTEKDRSIQILHFSDLSSIRPIYYDKTYHVTPEKGGEKAFELLRRAMLEENKVVGKRYIRIHHNFSYKTLEASKLCPLSTQPSLQQRDTADDPRPFAVGEFHLLILPFQFSGSINLQ